MPSALPTKHLLRISKGRSDEIGHFRYGIFLNASSGLGIDDLIEGACRDRFLLAHRFLVTARRIMAAPSPSYRTALARSYYAIYHGARSISFLVHKGDDHEAHKDLPSHLPKDFPDRARWENDIKIARLERNRADYDPYPKGESAFRASSNAILKNAEEFLPVARHYLRGRGCRI